MAPKLSKLKSTPKVDIEITFNNGNVTYTTRDIIEGVTKITSKVDTPFEAINIEFIGTARTYNDCNIATAVSSQRSEAVHRFLNLVQPGIRNYYPADSILKAGRTYHIPFRFEVPDRLASHVCSHGAKDAAAPQHNLRLPPSLGEHFYAAAQVIGDDMAPQMTRVRYETTVQVTEADGMIASRSKAVRIMPAATEEPLLDVCTQSSDCVTRQEKQIKKKFSKSRYGTLVVEAIEPQPILFTSVSDREAENTTVVNVSLRFDAANANSTPPKLRNVVRELQATTHFTTNARAALPTSDERGSDPYAGMYQQRIKLGCSNTMGGEWTKRHSTSDAAPSYLAQLQIPVTLPSNKTFVPTFHSCLISRVYTLTLTINMNTFGSQTSIQLRLPLQIAARRMLDQYAVSKLDQSSLAKLWELDVDDEKALSVLSADLPPSYMDVSGLTKFLPSVSVAAC